MDPRRLDPQQILERQGIAPFLQRQHDLTDPQVFNKPRQIVDGVAVDRLFDHRLIFVHADVADDGKAAFGPLPQCPQPLGARPCPQHQHPAAKG